MSEIEEIPPPGADSGKGELLAQGSATTPSFAEVFQTELGYVWNSLRRQGVPDRDLEDVTHEVFVVVHRRLPEFDASRPLRPWLFGIAFRCAASYRRKAGNLVEESRDEALDEPDASALPDERLAREEDHALVWRALDALPPERRAVVILHDFEDTPIPIIASALEVPLRTAYSRLRVGREELVAAIKRLKLKEGRP